MNIRNGSGIQLLIGGLLLITPLYLPAQSSQQNLKDQFLQQQYADVLLPLVQLKASNPGTSNFELNFMIAVSLCETDGNLKDGQDYFVAISHEYPLSKRWFSGERVDLAQVAQGICNFKLRAAAAPSGGAAGMGGTADSATDRSSTAQRSSGQIADKVRNKENVKANRNADRVP